MNATKYNIELDDAKWAVVKAKMMHPDRRKALMRELIRLDQQGALNVLGEIGRAEHGERARLRKEKNHWVSAA